MKNFDAIAVTGSTVRRRKMNCRSCLHPGAGTTRASSLRGRRRAEVHIEISQLVLCETWEQMIGLRDILVHQYLEVDIERLYDILQEELDDIQRIADIFNQFL